MEAETDFETLKYLVEILKLDPKEKSQGNSQFDAFLMSVANGNVKAAKYLVDHDDSFKHSSDRFDQTALMLAIDSVEMFNFLIECGCDPNYENKDGYTAFTICCMTQGKFENLKLLHEKSPELFKVRTDIDLDGLFFASSLEKVRFLVETRVIAALLSRKVTFFSFYFFSFDHRDKYLFLWFRL